MSPASALELSLVNVVSKAPAHPIWKVRVFSGQEGIGFFRSTADLDWTIASAMRVSGAVTSIGKTTR
jgi:hypothetical protein